MIFDKRPICERQGHRYQSVISMIEDDKKVKDTMTKTYIIMCPLCGDVIDTREEK